MLLLITASPALLLTSVLTQDCVQYAPTKSAMQFSSVNLITQSKPCFHIARFLPSIRDCQAPFTFAWQVLLSECSFSVTLAAGQHVD